MDLNNRAVSNQPGRGETSASRKCQNAALVKKMSNTRRNRGCSTQNLQTNCMLALELLLEKTLGRSYPCFCPSSMSCSKKPSAFTISVLPYVILTGAFCDLLWAKSCFTRRPGHTGAQREIQHRVREAGEPRGTMIWYARASTTFGHLLNRFPHLLCLLTSCAITKPLLSKRRSHRQDRFFQNDEVIVKRIYSNL